jgi:gamma-glutamyltranspeptidase/glutathione hydrolase
LQILPTMSDIQTPDRPVAATAIAAVTAGIPAAAEVGRAQIETGGNAFDAAVAAALVESVWLPMKCGLGGDVVAIYRQRNGPVKTLLSLGRGPLALHNGAVLERTGPRSVGAMGAPEGYARLAGMGRLGLQKLVDPAIAAAEGGVVWSDQTVRLTREAEASLREWNGALPFLPDGALPRPGQTLKLAGYARLLKCFARDGGRLFHGNIGKAVLDRISGLGGFLVRDDLVRAVATEMPATVHDLGPAGRLHTTPHPTHGDVVAMAVQALQSGMDEVSALRTAQTAFGAGAVDGGTSVVTAADSEGNRVVLVHSNSFPQYGSCVVVPDYDLVLNNRPGRGYALAAGADHWNRPDPMTIPGTTLNAWHLETDQTEFWGGTPGGENQAVWNMQTLSALMFAGATPQGAINAPKWALARDGSLMFEDDHPEAERPDAQTVPAWSQRSALQVIAIDTSSGKMTTGVDPRHGTASRTIPQKT